MILERFFFGSDCVIGRLLFGGEQVFTLEKPWLNNQTYVSCIPEGEYQLGPWNSERFPNVWQVRDVPGRTAILIHAANWADQIEGCIAPGLSYQIRQPSEDVRSCAVWNSGAACQKVFEYLVAQDNPTLTIKSVRAIVE